MRWQWQGKIDGILNFFRLLPFGISALSDFVINAWVQPPLGPCLAPPTVRLPTLVRAFQEIKTYETVTARFYLDRVDDRSRDHRYSGGRRSAGLPGLYDPVSYTHLRAHETP